MSAIRTSTLRHISDASHARVSVRARAGWLVLATALGVALAGCRESAPVGEDRDRLAICAGASDFVIGAGRADITGPFVGSSTGYSSPGDQMSGLAMRLYARAFVIESPCSGNRIVYVAAEQLHLYQSIKLGVLARLNQLGLGAYYHDDNVMIQATHTHAAPSNHSWRTLYNAFNGVVGYDKINYQIVVDGIADAIAQAHAARKPGRIAIAQGTLPGVAFNRSAAAYQQNVDKGQWASDVDETMTVLRFDGDDGSEIGAIDFFAVHGTSESISNRRIHGDNKGWAARELERRKGGNFVAAFGQGAVGDVSPNQPDPSDPAKPFQRPSDRDPMLTPNVDDPIVSGRPQLEMAWRLYASATTPVKGGIAYRYSYRDFNNILINPSYVIGAQPYDTDLIPSTCVGVVGGGFLAGDKDGAPTSLAAPGEIRNTYTLENGTWVRHEYDLSKLQTGNGDPIGSVAAVVGALWPLVSLALHTDQYDACQKEKFVLLPVGRVDDFYFPNPQVPFVDNIVPLQIAVIGDVGIIATPFELTTMVGRRAKQTVFAALRSVGIASVDRLLIAGLANSYGHYMTTREEYTQQYLEGSFDYYGPFADAALRQELDRIARDLAAGRLTDYGPWPPDLGNQQFVQTPLSANGVSDDEGDFGAVVAAPRASYDHVRDTVQVRFAAAHPESILDRKLAGDLSLYWNPATYTFLEIQRLVGGSWQTVYTDADPYTAFDWVRTGGDASATSEATVTWELHDEQPGTYRVVYNGLAKHGLLGLFATYQPFQGISPSFPVQ